ncbi:nitrite reductase large subunit [Rhodohalobacter sp. SW132]|uniref:nitrite reductase large subunit NirB n=1 Tax=Rhodohalobacter sp. SW132 TaxID=2293433 RepID=UPI000E248D3F|nr:nitrite reductase large subunit NirB [Rhodohalobacter sp. SW132]REL29180.1 nitrite reductase large subunit [Rhodohalobacter sp. SW132]
MTSSNSDKSNPESSTKKVIVVGNGMVGYKFCEKLRQKAAPNELEITVYGEEPRPAYDRVHLSDFFSEKNSEDLLMAPRKWYEDNDITLHTSQLVVDIDRENRCILTHKGNRDLYDKLILATGSSAFVPPIDGTDKEGVFVYRTIEDLEAIQQYGQKCKRVAVLGGGLLGLEAAKALLDMGLDTSVVEFAPRLMPRQLDESGAATLQEKLENLDLEILTDKQTQKITGNGSVESLKFSDETELKVDMLVISAGIRPRDELAKKCGLDTGGRGGILVNDLMKTNDESIYAIGEAALHNEMVYGLVAPGYEMAEVVASQIANTDYKEFTGFDLSTKLKLVGIDVASFGDPFTEKNAIPIVYQDRFKGTYKKIVVSEDGKKLLGGILVGDARAYTQLHQRFINQMECPENPEELILGNRGESGGGNGVEDLPEDAQVCSCENVLKGQITDLIKNEDVTEMGEIRAHTKAGTGCGGCTPLVKDLLNHTMAEMGKSVDKSLCDHFEYSRQELYDIIKVKNITTYDDLLDQFGKGDGCEVCKPAVASLLASAWNDLIINQDTIQDTNDRFLANIQRGGTYSVIPRVPGGEITPDKLLVIGQVAKKYGLYTKITGGQRIDLLGARVDQLPDIWQELVEAGFESGHGYAKALRTVKSCVGSTWCRYGLHDSVTFALDIEKRYRGLRAPHKIKGGVSGCIRECAEARGKDFGLIATEKGWNLYVGGNGGSKPQHAMLLASDIDEETCIQYLDRFLMFYIKTAEPLTRTSTWINKLDGGLEYLKTVVVDDALEIGDDLEKEMQRLVDAYKCEWKEVVENPDLQKKFRHFVNSDDPDPTIKFKEYREQKVPEGWGETT